MIVQPHMMMVGEPEEVPMEMMMMMDQPQAYQGMGMDMGMGLPMGQPQQQPTPMMHGLDYLKMLNQRRQSANPDLEAGPGVQIIEAPQKKR